MAALLAGGDGSGHAWPGIQAKLAQLGLSAPERLVVGRNLRALLRSEAAGPPAAA